MVVGVSVREDNKTKNVIGEFVNLESIIKNTRYSTKNF